MSIHRVAALLAGLPLLGCAPNLDWRQVRIAESELTLVFPCRPQRQSRMVDLGTGRFKLDLHVCSTGASTWAVSTADVGDPAQVSAVLGALSTAARANLGVGEAAARPARIPGATPNPAAARLELDGHMPDGSPATEHVAVFARGTRVFQATLLAQQPVGPEDVETFFDSLRFGP